MKNTPRFTMLMAMTATALMLCLSACSETQPVKQQPVAKAEQKPQAQDDRKGFAVAPRNTDEKQPPKEPILRIETGMHTATIRQIDTDAQNRYLVTGSLDKTVRIWELSTGKLLNVLRPPIGEGNEGIIQAVAMSPDGKIIACAGETGWAWDDRKVSIYLFERETGKMVGRIKDLPSSIVRLKYSKDGRFLAATIYGNNGIRIFRTSDGVLTGEDKEYPCGNIDFSKDDRLVTISRDGFILLYELKSDGSLKLLTKKAPGDKKRYSTPMFSPDGTKISVILGNISTVDNLTTLSTNVDVLSGHDLSYLFSPSTVGVDRILQNVAWSYDGNRLFGCGLYYKNGQYPILAWSDAGKGQFQELPGPISAIIHILPLKNGSIVFGAYDLSFGVISSSGERILFKSADIADLFSIKLSSDGKTVQFSYEQKGKFPAVFETDSRTLTLNGDASKLFLSDTSSLNITDWKYSFAPKLDGNTINLLNFEFSRSLAIAPDKNSFLLGTNWNIRLFDRTGSLKWRVKVPDIAWGVNISGDGKVAVAALGDGTIRWYSMTDGKELLAFFPHKDRKRWVMWTPSGYYTASAGGEDLIGWHINNGKDQAADFYPASRFRDTYYRPDITEKILVTLDEKEAIRLANEESGRRQQEVAIQQILPPKVIILSPQDGTELSNPEITVAYQADTPSDAPITEVKVLIDGRPLPDAKGFAVRQRETSQAKNEIRVRIPEKDCKVSVIAYNRHAASTESGVSLKWKGKTPAPDENILKPTLYVLAIGVANYKDTALQLKFAAKDAKDFAQVLEKQKGKLYRDVVTLVKQDATRADVLEGLEWIEKQTTSRDMAMVFLSGHGMNDSNGIYYFLPSDVNPDKIKSTGVPYSDIKNTVSNLPSKVVFFLDTCHSGNVMGEGRKGAMTDIQKIVNDLSSAENGVVVFASSTGKQYSLEDAKWGNGAFTKALVEGLEGGADYGKGKITVSLLDAFVCERVKELTNGRQTPVGIKPNGVTDFAIAVK